MASCCFPDICSWIQGLLPIPQWETNSTSISLYFSSTTTQPSLNFSVTKTIDTNSASFSMFVDFHHPVSLWKSKSFKTKEKEVIMFDDETISSLFCNFINDVLNYGPHKNTSFLYIPPLDTITHFNDIFNLSFFTLTLLICIYEAPQDLRSRGCLEALLNHLTSSHSREVSKMLMRLLGSNIEEQWMRSLNLAITNWILELKESNQTFRMLLPLFSYAVSTEGLWKVQLYCPIIAMDVESSSHTSTDERLLLSLRYHQLEGVIQCGYRIIQQEKSIDVVVKIDNIRCDVIRLVTERLMAKRGAGVVEKHFPSRICVQITPTLQTNVLSVSVSKSTENPIHEIGVEKTLEGGFDAPTSLGIKVSATETTTMSLKPWKFEQSVYGYSANLNWFLHDCMDGREVVSSKPSKLAMCLSKVWFKDRYSSAYRPFTKQGGVVFANDEYGQSVVWRVDKDATGNIMEWEIKGWIWLTYWPNKHRTFHSETRRFELKAFIPLPWRLLEPMSDFSNLHQTFLFRSTSPYG